MVSGEFRARKESNRELLGKTLGVVGMGRIGTHAYDVMRDQHGDTVVGIDYDSESVKKHQEAGRRVIMGDAMEVTPDAQEAQVDSKSRLAGLRRRAEQRLEEKRMQKELGDMELDWEEF